jgi:peptidoglycan/xylan/chitin deacetylase (PgdA/CDA1 family)
VSAKRQEPLKWKDLALEALFHCGGLRVLGRIAKSMEFASRSGGGRAFQRRSTPRFAILCYHRVGTGGVPLYSQLPVKAFEEQMRFLRENYRVVPLDQLIGELSVPLSTKPTVAITFDDGYCDLFLNAFPVLQALQIPATIFLTVGCIESGEVAWYDRIFSGLQSAGGETIEIKLDRRRSYPLGSTASRLKTAVEIISFLRECSPARRKACCADLESKLQVREDDIRNRMLTWDQIRTMHRGGIQFGAHTMTHPVVSRLSVPEMNWEICESKRILEERLDHPVRHFAFPFGKYEECGESAVSILARAGYRSAATTEWGLNACDTNPFYLRRVQIGEMGSLARFAFELTRLFLSGTAAPLASAHTANLNKGKTDLQPMGA